MVSKFNLEKMLSKSEITSMLRELAEKMGVSFSICDQSGKSIFTSGSDAHSVSIPLLLENSPVGIIHAPQAISIILEKLIHYILRTETEKSLLAKETLNIYREISYLYDMSDKISTSMEIEDIAHQVIEKTQKLIVGDKFSILLLDESQKLQLVAESVCDRTLSLTPIHRIIRRILKSGNGEIITDISQDPHYSPSPRSAAVSIMCVPLRIKGKAIGVIVISSKTLRDYPADQLKLLTMMASQVAIFIENARLYNRLRKVFIDTVYTLADTIEKRDPYTGGHTRRVMEYSLAIGEDLQLSAQELMNLRLAAILHDIGKIGIKDHILRKGGNFTEEEYQEIKLHPLVGEQILQKITELNHLVPGIKSHHERFDGRGYPQGLKGTEIPLIARIISVADAFDAMTSDRPYRKALGIKSAFNELRSMMGSQFDPKVTESFLKSFKYKNLKKYLPNKTRSRSKQRAGKEAHEEKSPDRG